MIHNPVGDDGGLLGGLRALGDPLFLLPLWQLISRCQPRPSASAS
jgi:hypothetical protein